MAAVWELQLLPTDKLVLLALADCANDDGHCWPSIATIARKSGVSERSVQRAIRKAEEAKLIHRQEVIGKGCKYRIDPRHGVTPDRVSPPTPSHPTPDTVSPKPSRTIKNPVGSSEPTTPNGVSVQQLQEAWNTVPAQRGAVECRRMGPERKRKAQVLLRRYPVEDITEAINAVARSDFLCGRGKTEFRADFDFLFSPKHMNRLLEGFYDAG